MLSSGRLRVDAQAAACGWLSAAPSLRFFYRLFLLLGAAFVAFLLTTGPADADDGSGPLGEVSVSSGIESQPVIQPVVEAVTQPVVETVQPVVEPVTQPVVERVQHVTGPLTQQ